MFRVVGALFCLTSVGFPVLLFAQSAPAPATPSPRQDSVFKAGSEEVLLDVTAHDKKGQLVTNLTSEDLAVFDNGVQRKISSFRLVQGSQMLIAGPQSGGPASEVQRQQLDPLRQVRLITLIFSRLDAVNDRQVAKNAALDLIKTELPQNVYVAVWVLDHNLKAIQEFSNDRDALRKAIEHATGGAYTQFDADSSRIQNQLQQLVGPATAGETPEEQISSGSSSLSSASGPGGGSGAGGQASLAMAQMMLNTLQMEQHAATAEAGRIAIIGLLNAVKEQYRLPGKKSVFYISDGFSVPQGLEETYRTVISTANRFNVTFYTVDAHGLNTTALNDAGASQLRGAASASRAQFSRSTTVTPQMAREMDNVIESGRTNMQNFLDELAKSTGGFMMANQNDFRNEMRKAVEEIETYYELTYNPGLEKYDGTFRTIELKTTRPGVKLISRSGYFALPPVEGGDTMAPYEMPLLTALNANPAPRDFAIHASAMHFRNGKDPICELVLDVPMEPFSFTKAPPEPQLKKTSNTAADTRMEGEFAYEVMVTNPQGDIVRKFHGNVPLNPKEDQVPALKQSHFFYTEHFALAPGRYLLKAAVMDRKSDKTAIRKSTFVMPGPSAALDISSIAVVRSVRSRTENTSADDPFIMQDKVITPTLSLVDKKDTQALSLYTVIYLDGANTAKPDLTIRFNKDGQDLGGGKPELGSADANGKLQYVATVPLDKFPPGNYEVQFVVRQGNELAREATTFTLE